MQKGIQGGIKKIMQGTNVFPYPLRCRCHAEKFKDPQISEINAEMYIWSEENETAAYRYDAFDHPELIPELVGACKKIRNGMNKEKVALEWVKKWGFLEENEIHDYGYGQTLESFLHQVSQFYTTWRFYKYIANRDHQALKNLFESPWDKLTHFSNDELNNYQWNGIMIIKQQIDRHIKNGQIHTAEVKKDAGTRKDEFRFTASYYFKNLIDAIYMQFYIALSESKKVCPTCEAPFTPERKNEKYCSITCKNTAKSQRYRKKYLKENGVNYWERKKST